jgi:tetratricopeptide (TPR) repeat protein
MAENNICSVDVNFVVVWLDKEIEKTKENQDSKALIRHTVRNQLKTFENPDECVDYIITEQNKRIFFIVSGSFGYYIVPLIYQLPQIQSIYIFCVNRQRAEEWAQPHLKISGVFTSKKTLVEKLRDDIHACDKDSHLPMSIFHLEDRQNSLRNLTEDSATFMWYQLLIVVLQRLARSSTSKNEMITECRLLYHIDPVEQGKINKFEREYTSEKAIWWYTYDCFVYRLLNQALRTQNIDIIFRFRFFINDLHNQIKQLYLKYLRTHQPLSERQLTVFRGQHLSMDELNLLKQNINGLISMNTFLSATLNKNLALIFAETDIKSPGPSSIQAVLFIIDIFDMSQETTPFAPIKSYSCYEEEDEVLFTIGAVFKVESVEQMDDMWHVKLQLSKEQNKLCRDLSLHIMKQIGSDASPLALGWFLYRMSDFNKAERYAESLLKQLSNKDRETGNTYNLLGLICKDTGRLKQAIEYYEKALQNYSHTSPPDSPQLIAVHYNLGLAYLSLGDHQHASEHQQKAKQRLVNSSQTNNPLLIAMTDSLQAKVETAHGNYVDAFKNLEDVLKTKQKTLPEGHPSIASTLKDMGVVQAKMGNDENALGYFIQALNINQKSLSPYHLDLADCHANIGRVHYKRQEYSLALEQFRKALDIVKDASREDIDNVEALQKCIKDTEQMMTSLKDN